MSLLPVDLRLGVVGLEGPGVVGLDVGVVGLIIPGVVATTRGPCKGAAATFSASTSALALAFSSINLE
jgi:hypothetical protein